MHMEPFTHNAYTTNEDFMEVFQQLQGQSNVKDDDNKDDYHLQNELLYRMEKLCVPKGERLQLIREDHTSKVVSHLALEKQLPTYRGMCTSLKCKKM